MLKSLGRFSAGALLLTLVAGAGVGILGAGTAGATTVFTVTTTADPALASAQCPAATNPCSLRAAVAAANATVGGASIDVPAGTYTLTIAPTGGNDNSTGDLNITGTVTIAGQGASAADTVIDGNATDRIFDVASGATADLSELTIQNGKTSGADNAGPAQQNGGGIANDGTLTLLRVAVSDNTGDGGGGIDLINAPSTTLTDVTINGNTGGSDGGGLELEQSSTPGTVSLDGALIDSNTSDDSGGGIGVDGGYALTVTDSTISNNKAISGTNYGGGVFVDGNGSTDTFSGDTIDGNQGFFGGGLAVQSGATSVDTTSISSNIGVVGIGGVLDDDANTNETLTITNSTISGNSATDTVAPVVGAGDINAMAGDGGGMLVFGCANASLTNDTIVGNHAADGTNASSRTDEGDGGGYVTELCFTTTITTPSPTTNTFVNDTFANNYGGVGGGGDFGQADYEQVNLSNSIIAYGTPVSCGGFLDADHETNGGYNMYTDNADNCSAAPAGEDTDIGHTDPLLGALGDNGGPTQTEAPLTGSPAIGAIPTASCILTTDQRGEARPQGPGDSCTIGAVEEAVGASGPPAGGGGSGPGGSGGGDSGGGPSSFNPNGYRMAAADGGAFDFGTTFSGSLAGVHLNAPIVGMANEPDANGYLMVGADGGVYSFGGAGYFGSLGGQTLPSPIAAIAATPDGGGYWLVSKAGKSYAFGDAPALPVLGTLNKPIVGAATDPSGQGLWLVSSDGGVFALGDAAFEGSLGSLHLNAPIVGIAPIPSGQGYVLAAADGGVFTFKAGFFGSAASVHLNAPVTGIAETNSGNGYWLSAADGGVFAFGDAPFLGSLAGQRLNAPMVGIQHLGAPQSG